MDEADFNANARRGKGARITTNRNAYETDEDLARLRPESRSRFQELLARLPK